MAKRDHTLDDGIIQAAYEEFLTHGFRNASLHQIAQKAGVTTGAIYTRYKNKDALFVSLLQDFFGQLEAMFAPAAAEYKIARQSGKTDDLLHAIQFEEQLYVQLLTRHYDACTLFFSRSDGSSVEGMLKELMEQKTQQTVAFFQQVYGRAPNPDAVRLLMGAQFWYFRQLLDERLEEERMFACLKGIMAFTDAGWRHFCDSLT